MWKVTKKNGALWFTQIKFEIQALRREIAAKHAVEVRAKPENYPYGKVLQKDMYVVPDGRLEKVKFYCKHPDHIVAFAEWVV